MEDLLVIVQTFMKSDMTYSSLYRLLKRHKVAPLRQQAQETRAEGKEPKSFKNYAPGFLHGDIKYLPKMPDDPHHRYLFVAIDRATRWVFFNIYDYPNQESRRDFLDTLQEKCPIRIEKNPDRQRSIIHRPLPHSQQGSQRKPRLRPGLCQEQH
jgi:hypothetical protein